MSSNFWCSCVPVLALFLVKPIKKLKSVFLLCLLIYFHVIIFQMLQMCAVSVQITPERILPGGYFGVVVLCFNIYSDIKI